MWLPVLLAALGMVDVAPPDREAAVTEACAAWMAGRASDGPAVHTIGDDGLCFFGGTNDTNSTAFVEAVSMIDPETPLVVVVRSGGGEINAAMAMAEVLVPRHATVIAQNQCLSSCANYLFLAGDRRVVAQGALLGFHGGIFEQPEAYWDAMRADLTARLDAASVEASMKASRDYATDSLTRQAALLESVDVDVDLFKWMQGLNDLPEEEKLANCPVPNAILIVFSDAILAERGVVIHHNDGLNSDADLAGDIGRLSGSVCYWD